MVLGVKRRESRINSGFDDWKASLSAPLALCHKLQMQFLIDIIMISLIMT